MSRIKLLAQRRALLITECALQRVTLIGQTDHLCVGNSLVSRLKSLPGWLSGLLVGLAIIAPGRAVSWAKKGLMLWQVWHAVSRSLLDLGRR